jgi:head-tail adaptor
MRNRVDVQTAVTTSDTFSQDTQVWTSISTHWAEITFVSGRFIQNALQNKEESRTSSACDGSLGSPRR